MPVIYVLDDWYTCLACTKRGTVNHIYSIHYISYTYLQQGCVYGQMEEEVDTVKLIAI